MKVLKLLILAIAACVTSQLSAQSVGNNKKGQLYYYWGWNGSDYTKSDTRFTGDQYDFTVKQMQATDRQTEFGWIYFDPVLFTIPQYNARIGYFFKDNWSLSFGMDHMKYVMVQDQMATLEGYNHHPSSIYQGQLDGQYKMSNDFMMFEHTDGLNYGNLSLRYHSELVHFPIDKKGRGITLNAIGGVGGGFLMPRTNVTLFGQKRHDEFHFAGYGFDATVAAQVDFWRYFFIQGEFKGGYINMPDIRTTASKSDKASQDFGYIQYNILFGVKVNLIRQQQKGEAVEMK